MSPGGNSFPFEKVPKFDKSELVVRISDAVVGPLSVLLDSRFVPPPPKNLRQIFSRAHSLESLLKGGYYKFSSSKYSRAKRKEDIKELVIMYGGSIKARARDDFMDKERFEIPFFGSFKYPKGKNVLYRSKASPVAIDDYVAKAGSTVSKGKRVIRDEEMNEGLLQIMLKTEIFTKKHLELLFRGYKKVPSSELRNWLLGQAVSIANDFLPRYGALLGYFLKSEKAVSLSGLGRFYSDSKDKIWFEFSDYVLRYMNANKS